MNEQIQLLLQLLTSFANSIGMTVGQLLDSINEERAERSSELSWPPPFTVSLEKVDETSAGFPILALTLHNVDRDITSFDVDLADFDPDNDGTVNIVDADLGELLVNKRWFFQYREDIGRLGAFQSRIQELEADPDRTDVVLCHITIDRDDEVTLEDISVSGNYSKSEGEQERHFTHHAFANATYRP